VVACYFVAVAFGHDSGKFVHDFLNIIHLEGYQSKQHSYHVPRVLRYFVLIFLLVSITLLRLEFNYFTIIVGDDFGHFYSSISTRRTN
jgi:hypothetical protein